MVICHSNRNLIPHPDWLRHADGRCITPKSVTSHPLSSPLVTDPGKGDWSHCSRSLASLLQGTSLGSCAGADRPPNPSSFPTPDKQQTPAPWRTDTSFRSCPWYGGWGAGLLVAMPSSPFEIAISEWLLSIRETRIRGPCHAQESVTHRVKGGAHCGSSISGFGANRAPLLPPAAWAEPGPGWWRCSILHGSHASPNVWGSTAQPSA